MSRVNQIYLMRNPLGLLKVGVSDLPERRAISVTNASGFKTELIRTLQVPDAYGVEKKIHAKFHKFRKEGEWLSWHVKTLTKTAKLYYRLGWIVNYQGDSETSKVILRENPLTQVQVA